MGERPAQDEAVSLYRRFRPARFAELRGQPHVVQALRSAVASGSVGHAYLFSGPRGTGKTSTARILARALNCTNPTDGEPCGVCPSCVDIVRGTSLDVHELDAASNNGVDAMRDLVAHAALATPGRSKVYIVDEVHMLSNAAANSLLKTLEEPPGHVVFVLATTDPQKVPPTIRSRTQHFEFRLFSADALESLLRDVRDEAGLTIDDQSLAVAVRKGHGSARDALSALDQVAAAGTAELAHADLSEVLDALCEADVGRLLVATAALLDTGWAPQQLATELVDDLHQAFLVSLAPELAEATGAERERVADAGSRLGLARLVRAMEVVGRSLVEMRDAPDVRVVLELGLVRLVRPELDDSTDAILDRLARLEQGAPPRGVERRGPDGGAGAPTPGGTAGSSSRPAAPIRRSGRVGSGAPAAPAPDDPAPPVAAESARPASPPGPSPEPVAVGEGPAAPPPTPPPTIPPSGPPPAPRAVPDRDALTEAWGDHVLRGLPGRAKALYSAGRFVASSDGSATFALPNAVHRDRCADVQGVVEEALAAHFGQPIPLTLVVDGQPGGTGQAEARGHREPAGRSPAEAPPGPPEAPEDQPEPSGPPPRAGADRRPHDPGEEEESVDPELLRSGEAVESVAEQRILEAFPGAIEVAE